MKLSSSLSTLHPFLDDIGLLRVGGRLKESNIENKHPYIISGSHIIATTIVRDVHNLAHVGVEWVLGLVRRRFWLIGARRLIKRVGKACVTCKRLYSKTLCADNGRFT